ncbi:MAG: methylated-DNA--[protein]-cysteine S-methyltransferase, partial [bacterium]
MTTLYSVIDSSVGPLLLTADERGLTRVWFDMGGESHRPRGHWQRAEDAVGSTSTRTIDTARTQLDEYFAGHRTQFELPLSPEGTEFQRRVWDALAEIPFGTTISYLELARTVGDPRAVRAVGGANGRNPLPIVLPCHRVIGADGSLTGFGGGIERKRWLLEHEGAI